MSSDAEYTLHRFKHLGRRSILPLLPHPGLLRSFAQSANVPTEKNVPDGKNVQGDVIYLFPKTAENFVFFRINDAASFKAALKLFQPTSSDDVIGHLSAINDAKADALARGLTSTPIVEIKQYQIAFSRAGLYALGVQENIEDPRFDQRCMADDKQFLGDTDDWDPIFDKPGSAIDPMNGSVRNDNGALHGVITVAGSSPETCTQATNDVIKLFGTSMTVSGKPMEGRTRPAPNRGREHFGYMDGISQPAIRGLVPPRPGQTEVDPGVIIMGYPGDPRTRPAWTKDGTIMVFRKLEQLVVTFDDWLARAATRWPEYIPGGDVSANLSKDEAMGLFGARVFGRWKSGAPVARCPIRDNRDVAGNELNISDDPEENNNFDYFIRDNPNISPDKLSDFYCPFNAHTRKLVPRNLDPYVSKKSLEETSIMRGGLPYGGEVTDQERQDFANGKPEVSNRGLLFNCYMSNLELGFIHQTLDAKNNAWPMTSAVAQNHGQDLIIGNPPVDPPVPGVQLPPGVPNPRLLNSRGGEYFFVPSISTLKGWADAATPTATTPETSIQIEAGFKVTVTGLARAAAYQRGTFNLKDASGRVIATSTLVGTGNNTSLTQEIDDSPVWTFGPSTKPMTLNVLIEHASSADAQFSPSRIVPVTVRKEPDAVTPQTYIVTTILSEDSTDNDFNDGIISIFQFK